MFKKASKSPFDDVQTLYDEETSAHHSGFSYQRNERLDTPPSLFDSPKSMEPRPIEARPLPSFEEPSQTWSANQNSNELAPLFAEEPETTLGEGVSFKGELTFERLLRIDGFFEGSLVSKGKIIIGPKGHVKADIHLQEAIIEGTLEGNLTIAGKVELRGGAVVKGDIQAGSLCVDEGVKLLGYVAVSGSSLSQIDEDL